MPRTKVSKSSKRNRDAAAKEEKIRNFENCLEEFQNNLELQRISVMEDIDNKIDSLKGQITDTVLDMAFDEFLNLNLSQFRDYTQMLEARNHSRSDKKTRTQDDGYITEESGNSASSSAHAAYLSMTQRGRTPGPLTAARARQNRRSQSASNDQLFRSTLVTKQSTNAPALSSHKSRNKLRTPMGPRPKTVSADRSILLKKMENQPQSPPAAFLRWPKPGEIIVSIHGTPITAPIAAERIANVNIPIKDGVLSLRPRNLETLDSNIVENIDPETFRQLKTLHKSLGMIVQTMGEVGKDK